jgi:hypothetical protein
MFPSAPTRASMSPIMPFGPQAEPGEGMAKSYAGKS